MKRNISVSMSSWIDKEDPQYWYLLSEADKAKYRALRLAFTPGGLMQSRIYTSETLEEILGAIRVFAERGDENDWRRFLVCGICWLDNAIAINTRQLRLLLSKCKSSINGSLQKMGYTTNTSNLESRKILFPKIPLLKDNFNELRQWTIRYKTEDLEKRAPQKPVPAKPELPAPEVSIPPLSIPRLVDVSDTCKRTIGTPPKFRLLNSDTFRRRQ